MIYNGDNDYQPDNASQKDKWTKQSGGSFSIAVETDANCDNGKRFRLDTSPTDYGAYCSYYHNTVGQPFYDHVSNTNGYDVQVRVKIIDGGSNVPQIVEMLDGKQSFYLSLFSNRIVAHSLSGGDQTYTHDFSAAYHAIKISIIGTSLIIKVDGVTQITGTLNTGTITRILRWGDRYIYANCGGEVYWDYIKYKCY